MYLDFIDKYMDATSAYVLCIITLYLQSASLTVSSLKTGFQCNDGNEIGFDKFCDGFFDCSDGSDEIDDGSDTGSNIICKNPGVTISKHCLLETRYFCEDLISCHNMTKCDARCNTHYLCQNGDCMERSTICDGPTCKGCSEDHGWTNGIGFKCRKNGLECVLPQQLIWDDLSDCDGNIDKCFEFPNDYTPGDPWDLRNDPAAIFNTSLCFLCFDNSTIIPRSGVCDGIIDCPDLSDECVCQNNIAQVCQHMQLLSINNNTIEDISNTFKCFEGKILNVSYICNGVMDCLQAEDERCSYYLDLSSCERRIGIPCNNIEECSPSQIPFTTGWTDEGFPDDECVARCSDNPNHNYTCGTDGMWGKGNPLFGIECSPIGSKPFRYNFTSIDVNVSQFNLERRFTTLLWLPNNFFGTETVELIEEYLTVIYDGEIVCDGIVHCKDLKDEKNCFDRFKCSAKDAISIPLKDVCNGIIDCDFGEDEDEELCKDRERFYCPAQNGWLVSIQEKYVCDFYIDCDDKSDEANCSTNERFYCENGIPLFVTNRRVKDGRPDCSDWSDECPTQGQFKTDNVFSSKSELIANLFLRVWIWIMATLALGGNLAVIFHEVHLLWHHDHSTALFANRILIINLAIADLLMGIYLFGIAIKSALVSGSYCSQDLTWRSSSACSFLGVLSSLSSEASISIMVMLTSCRMFTVVKPHMSYSFPRKFILRIMVACSWLVASVLAFLPLSPLLQNIFIDKISLTSNPFAHLRGISLNETRTMIHRMLTYDLNNLTSKEDITSALSDLPTANWDKLTHFGVHYSNHPEYFHNINYFGYYSQSVCVQKFFVTTSDAAWHFSFVVNVFNFLAFIYVASAYTVIYIKALKIKKVSTKTNQSEKKTQSMQRKILRLVITDFCCWIPITVMAFVQLASGKLPDEAYPVAAIVLLPINSALNPILYSDFLDKLVRKLSRKKDTEKSSSSTKISKITSNGSTDDFSKDVQTKL